MNPTLYHSNTRPEIEQFVPKKFHRVLEVGCADGTFSRSQLRRKADVELWGIDPNEASVEEARKHLDRVLMGTFDDVCEQLPVNHFDLVVCNDVIEHLPCHDAFLRNIQKFMSEGGALIGSVPNMRYGSAMYRLLVQRDWPYAEQGVMDRTHLRWFTRKSLQNSFERNGLEVRLLRGINTDLEKCTIARKLAHHVISCATLGQCHDMRFPQFGFQVVVQKPKY